MIVRSLLNSMIAMGLSASALAQGPIAPVASRPNEITLVTVGDLILSRPLSILAQPGAFPEHEGLKHALDLLADADITYGNMETSIFDYRSFKGHPYSWDGDWMLTADPAIVTDLRTMGFDLVSRANNHALDWGIEGMRATIAALDAGGLTSAGTGETSEQATAPAYVESGIGKAAIVSMVSTYRPTTDALPPGPVAPRGRPGVNALTVTPATLVDAPTFEQLRQIACSFARYATCSHSASTLDLFGTEVRHATVGERPFTYVYKIDQADLDRNVAAVRAAKAQSRLVLATIHAHEGLTDELPPTSWQDPAAFLEPLAHAMIDAGADAFIVSGIHHVAGLGLYKGKPIFYGLGNFFWSDMQEPLSAELYQSSGNHALLATSFEHPDRATDADLTNILNANSTFATVGDPTFNRTFQSVIAKTAYDRDTGAVSSIRLYPIDLGYGEKLTQSGVPRLATGPIAGQILDRIIALSGKNNGLTIRKIVEGGHVIGLAEPIR